MADGGRRADGGGGGGIWWKMEVGRGNDGTRWRRGGWYTQSSLLHIPHCTASSWQTCTYPTLSRVVQEEKAKLNVAWGGGGDGRGSDGIGAGIR